MTNKFKKNLSIFISCMLLCSSLVGCSVGSDKVYSYKNNINSIVGKDIYGRTIEEAIEIDEKKQVGMFYFLWQDFENAIMDNTRLLEHYGNTMDNPLWDAKQNEVTNLESAVNAFHYWGEPLYGYYNSSDPWVIRKHLKLFISAGIDFLAIDATNGYFYQSALVVLLQEISNLIEQGFNAPKVCLYTSPFSYDTVERAYEAIYKTNLYPDAWYKIDGKPVIIGNPNINDYTQEVRDFFKLIPGIWPGLYDVDNAWPWIAWEYPQHNFNGTISVSAAQHVKAPFSISVNPSSDETRYNSTWGRGFSHKTGINSTENVGKATNLAEQWERVLNDKESVNRVFVTGWNEWIAQKLADEMGRNVRFVDTVNEEFSRDIEMVKGGYGDTYYLLNAKFMREFKASKLGKNYVKQTSVDILDRNKPWGGKTYQDMTGDCSERDYQGSSKYIIDYSNGQAEKVELPNYRDNTNRNDIKAVTVASDSEYLYLKIETLRNLDIIYNDVTGSCLNVFLSFEGKSGDVWEGYQYKLNHNILSKNKTTLHKATGKGYEWEKVAEVDCNIYGNVMAIKVPLSVLGVLETFTLDFKVTDNVSNPSDIMSYYIYGDSAPIGRLNYRYNVSK